MPVTQGLYIYKNLAELNELSAVAAEELFLECSGSPEWARNMANLRPFHMLEDLFEKAEAVWYSLNPEEQIQAYRTQISDREKGDQDDRSDSANKAMSIGKEGDKDEIDADSELKAAMGLYRKKFGFIFVFGSSVSSNLEILALCRERLLNTREAELKIAAREKMNIIEDRLSQLLEK